MLVKERECDFTKQDKIVQMLHSCIDNVNSDAAKGMFNANNQSMLKTLDGQLV